MQGFAPRKHPRQACSLDCIAKLRFAFQSALPADVSKKLRQPASFFPAPAGQHLSDRILYRAPHLPAATTYLPVSAGQQPFAAYLSVPAHTILCQPATSQFRLDRPVHFLSHSFLFSFFSFFFLSSHPAFFPNKKRNRLRQFLFLFLQSQIQPKHLLRNLFHCPSRRPVSILFRTGHAVVIHKRHQVTSVLDFSLDFGNFLFFFFF